MATKTAKRKHEEVGVMFKAPHEIRGAIRFVSAWAEMNNVRINGRTPLEKDIWAWIAASFYKSGESSWAEQLSEGHKSFQDMTASQN
jgi:hypothetical protein